MKRVLGWCITVVVSMCVLVAAVDGVERLEGDDAWEPSSCPPRPYCEDREVSSWDRASCRVSGYFGLATNVPAAHAVVKLERLLRRNVKGQDHILMDIVRDVRAKLHRPHEPLVMHFAGDNGVGKTTVADLISAAVSRRCHPGHVGTRCTQGDALLSLSATNYHGMPVSEFRKQLTTEVLAHARAFPNGVVVINDLTTLDPHHAQVLMPLLGRGSYFPEDAKVDLRKLIVIVTTDFGHEGRTRGRNLEEVKLMIEEEIRSVLGPLAASYMRTYPFLPSSLAAAAQMARLALEDWACDRDLASLRFEPLLVESLSEQCVERVAVENGRAVMMLMSRVVSDMEARFVANGNCTSSLQHKHIRLALQSRHGATTSTRVARSVIIEEEHPPLAAEKRGGDL